jgi:hypothetical protein
MQCVACRAAISRFDVHCRACNAPQKAPPLEQQLVSLEMDIDAASNEAEALDHHIGKQADRSRNRAVNLEAARGMAALSVEATGAFIRAIFSD